MIEAETLRVAREFAGLTQQDLASLVGVHVRSVANWERKGSRVPEQKEASVRKAMRRGLEFAETTKPELLGMRISDLTQAGYKEAVERGRHAVDQILHQERLRDSRKYAEEGIAKMFSAMEDLPLSEQEAFRHLMLKYFSSAELFDEVRERASKADFGFDEAPIESESYTPSADVLPFFRVDDDGELSELDYAADDRQTAPDEDEHQP